MAKKKLRSIDELARLAGVAKSTVSRALNDSPLVNPETKARIVELAREWDFSPSFSATNLSRRTSRTMAFVTHAWNENGSGCKVSDPFSLEILGGIAIGLAELGYDLLVVHIDPDEQGWAREYLASGRVDGFILMTSEQKTAHIDHLVEIGAPFVAWGRSEGPYCTVMGDDLRGGRLATAHLIERGRRQIAFLGGPKIEVEVKIRQQGYREALESAGRSLDPRLVAYGDYTEASGARAMEELLARSPELDAVFCNSDLMAVAAMKALARRGIRVPEDIAVVGYDDLSIASYASPELTTVSQNIPLAGKLLARQLVEYLENGIVTHTTVPVELVVRASS